MLRRRKRLFGSRVPEFAATVMPSCCGLSSSSNILKTFLPSCRPQVAFSLAPWRPGNYGTLDMVSYSVYISKSHRAQHNLRHKNVHYICEMAWFCALFCEMTESGFCRGFFHEGCVASCGAKFAVSR